MEADHHATDQIFEAFTTPGSAGCACHNACIPRRADRDVEQYFSAEGHRFGC
ncbi:MAG: hypothetical protein ACC742_16360 [Thermoanaerobaculales bacterium]